MRLFRMTTRRWMVAVAGVGVGVGGWIQIVRWGRLREYYEAWAEMHAESASQFRQDADRTRDEWLSECRRVDEENRLRERGLKKSMYKLRYPLDPVEGRRAVAHFKRLRRIYERAARYSWLPVEPDPPEPN
jgi:hypothetical protein